MSLVAFVCVALLSAENYANKQASLREANQFAQTVLQARRLIDENYILPDRGLPALEAGIRSLFPNPAAMPEDIRRRLEMIDSLRAIDLARLLEDVRLRTERMGIGNADPLEACLTKIADSLDPYSAYIPPVAWEEMQAESNGGFVGIGVKLREIPETKETVVVTTILNSPAFQKGIRAQDRIVEVDGVDTSSSGMDDTARRLSGQEGKPVQIGIKRPHVDGVQNLTVVRRKVRVESVLGRRRLPDFSWDYWLDEKQGIVYVRIASFAAETAADLERVLKEYHDKGMKALVLDLRYNLGGLLDSALETADLFLDEGVIVSIRDRQGNEDVWHADDQSPFGDLKLAVLVNRESASGSEIVSAAIFDHQRGVIVGERTFGKGSIQNLHPLQDGKSILKLTTATFHRPNGQNLHRFPNSKPSDDWGVQPTQGFEIVTSRADVDELQKRIAEQEIIQRPDQPPVFEPFADPALEKARQYLEQAVNVADR